MKNTLLIYVPIYSCFFPVNLTLIMVLYNLTHISLILPSTKCFLVCILFKCWCLIVLLYFKWCSVSRVNVLLSDKKEEVTRLEEDKTTIIYSIRWLQVLIITILNRPRFLNYNLLLIAQGLGSVLNFINFLVSISHFGNFTACLTTLL